jgi:hypothetical protein
LTYVLRTPWSRVQRGENGEARLGAECCKSGIASGYSDPCSLDSSNGSCGPPSRSSQRRPCSDPVRSARPPSRAGWVGPASTSSRRRSDSPTTRPRRARPAPICRQKAEGTVACPPAIPKATTESSMNVFWTTFSSASAPSRP